MGTRTGRLGRRLLAPIALAAVSVTAARAVACDVCAVYTATEMQARRTGLRLGVFEQLTRFTTLRRDGREVPNRAGEELNSSITQVLAGYNFTPRVGLQLNLPLVSRTFRRVEGTRLADDDETGLGDMSLTANVLAFSRVSEESVFHVTLLGGLELPTGDTGRLAEELLEDPHAEPHRVPRLRRAVPRHTVPAPPPGGGDAPLESGIHGHDLALGSGSVDGLVGAQAFWSWRRLFVTASGQYAVRTAGDFDYEFANELSWHGGPGVMLLLDHRYTLGVQGLVAGETKGKDRQAGARLDDTAITALYAGPGVLFTWGTALGLELAADLPVVQHETALQIVADYRIRGGLTWRF
jgi:hypothetical protein